MIHKKFGIKCVAEGKSTTVGGKKDDITSKSFSESPLL